MWYAVPFCESRWNSWVGRFDVCLAASFRGQWIVKTRDNCLAFVAIAMILTARAVCSVCMLVCLSHDIHIYADFLMRCSIQWLSDVWFLLSGNVPKLLYILRTDCFVYDCCVRLSCLNYKHTSLLYILKSNNNFGYYYDCVIVMQSCYGEWCKYH